MVLTQMTFLDLKYLYCIIYLGQLHVGIYYNKSGIKF